jgi:fumarylacetoacetate (FAA) hydrolase
MKLASLKHGRDGRLVVVSRDLTRYVDASHIAPSLQAALDTWKRSAPRLETLASEVELGSVPTERFREKDCASPLPRAYQWADASAYVNHVDLVRRARGAEMPPEYWTDPLIYQGGSDVFLGPRDPLPLGAEDWGCDMEAEVAVVCGDVRAGADRDQAARSIRLVMLANDLTFRNLIPAELAKGFGFFQSKPPGSFSPVCVTPDELGEAWDGARLHGTMHVNLNGQPFGRAHTGIDMTFDFPTLIAHAARTRALSAGTIVGSGTVSNRGPEGSPGLPVSRGGVGYSCIAEQRMVEILLDGAARTSFLRAGDRVEIEMLDERGRSIFGRIDQTVEA